MSYVVSFVIESRCRAILIYLENSQAGQNASRTTWTASFAALSSVAFWEHHACSSPTAAASLFLVLPCLLLTDTTNTVFNM